MNVITAQLSVCKSRVIQLWMCRGEVGKGRAVPGVRRKRASCQVRSAVGYEEADRLVGKGEVCCLSPSETLPRDGGR